MVRLANLVSQVDPYSTYINLLDFSIFTYSITAIRGRRPLQRLWGNSFVQMHSVTIYARVTAIGLLIMF